MRIPKFSPQYRNKCYCQMQRECYHNYANKADKNNNQNKRYFVKMRNSSRPNPIEHQPHAPQFEFQTHPTGTSSQLSTVQDIHQTFPNQLNSMLCNHATNPIRRNSLNNKTPSADLKCINGCMNTIQTYNYHSDEATYIPNSKLFNVIYDRYEKLREIETFRVENANECISVLNQQTNHNRVANKSVVKHVCQHRYRYLMEPTISNGRGESKCELCEKWCGLERLKNTVANGNCCIVDKIDASNFVHVGDGTDDCKIILEIQNLNISPGVKAKPKQLKKKINNRSWHLKEQAKSLALNQQRRY